MRCIRVAQQLVVEAGADVAGVDELPAFVDADEQRAEPVREPRGSVQPPITNSWRRLTLIFTHSRERIER